MAAIRNIEIIIIESGIVMAAMVSVINESENGETSRNKIRRRKWRQYRKRKRKRHQQSALKAANIGEK
jgi:hypothetical protein